MRRPPSGAGSWPLRCGPSWWNWFKPVLLELGVTAWMFVVSPCHTLWPDSFSFWEHFVAAIWQHDFRSLSSLSGWFGEFWHCLPFCFKILWTKIHCSSSTYLIKLIKIRMSLIDVLTRQKYRRMKIERLSRLRFWAHSRCWRCYSCFCSWRIRCCDAVVVVFEEYVAVPPLLL